MKRFVRWFSIFMFLPQISDRLKRLSRNCENDSVEKYENVINLKKRNRSKRWQNEDKSDR